MNTFIDLLSGDLDFVDSTLRALRERLDLDELSSRERCRCKSRWFKTGEVLGERAARMRTAYARFMEHLPFDAQDILLQVARVNRANHAVVQLQQTTRLAQDTLLRERSRLYEMIMAVLKSLETYQQFPGLDAGTRGFLIAGIKLLRGELDRRNQKISQSKQSKAKLPVAGISGAGAALAGRGEAPVQTALPAAQAPLPALPAGPAAPID